MAISKRLRFEILRRDNHACRYCGATAPDVPLTVDHVIPTTLGGDDQPTNLVTACRDCNAGKSSSSTGADMVANVAADAMRWAAAMVRAADLARQQRDAMVAIEGAVLDFWSSVPVPYMPRTFADYMPQDWYVSVQRWVAAGLTQDDLIDASHITIFGRSKPAKDAWKYFCGVVWRTLEDRQSVARALINADEADKT